LGREAAHTACAAQGGLGGEAAWQHGAHCNHLRSWSACASSTHALGGDQRSRLGHWCCAHGTRALVQVHGRCVRTGHVLLQCAPTGRVHMPRCVEDVRAWDMRGHRTGVRAQDKCTNADAWKIRAHKTCALAMCAHMICALEQMRG